MSCMINAPMTCLTLNILQKSDGGMKSKHSNKQKKTLITLTPGQKIDVEEIDRLRKKMKCDGWRKFQRENYKNFCF